MRLLAGIAGMQQDDVALVRLLDDSVYDRIHSGIFPIERIRIPLNDLVVKLVRDAEHALVEIPVGQSDQRRGFAGHIP